MPGTVLRASPQFVALARREQIDAPEHTERTAWLRALLGDLHQLACLVSIVDAEFEYDLEL